MALNASGPISLAGTTAGQSIQLENGGNGTTQISLNDTAVRNLAGVASGQITMPTNFWGKSNAFTATISSNQTNLNLRTWALANGWNGSSAAAITIGSNVYIYSTATGTPALTTGSFPGGLTIITNGFIMGMGGAGGTTGAGNAGGNAISLGVNTTITNNSYIGGGGGGAGGLRFSTLAGVGGGGGAGGGAGGAGRTGSGGTGGGVGASGSNGTGLYGGGGGGRVMPGTGGASRTGGYTGQVGLGGSGGGGGGADPFVTGSGCYCRDEIIVAGGGGGWGASGGRTTRWTSYAGSYASGAGGSAGNAGGNAAASGSTGATNAAGGAGGKCVALNGYSVTWTVNGTRYGAIS